MASIDRVLASSRRRWIEDLWSGLKLLAESGLRDFEPLHSAKRALPAPEQAAWTELIGDLESRVAASMREEVEADAIFIEFLASLNERWCLEREILVSRSKRIIWGDHEPDLWDAVPASISCILRKQVCQFHDAAIPVYFVQTACPTFYSDHSAYFDPSMKSVVLNVDKLRCEAMIGGLLSADSPEFRAYIINQGFPPFVLAALKLYHRVLMTWHKDANQRATMAALRTLIEELSHAIHALRAGLDVPSFECYDDHLIRLGETLLAPEGRLRREIWNTAAQGLDPDLADPRARTGQSCGKLAAQMTAAAVGSDPYLVLLEWLYWVRVISHGPTDQPLEELLKVVRTDMPHLMAAAMGIILLADELALPHRLSLGGVRFADKLQSQCCLLEELVEKLLDRRRSEIRLALKAVFQREFGHAIDEAPFSQIDSAGKLLPRPASGSAGAGPL
ncbi:MAG: hypothetical protein WD847_09720 [Pirellulales bacterium]